MENPSTHENPTPNADASAAPARADGAGRGAAVARAGDAAVEQHLAEAPRGRGRPIIHGKYSTRVPVADVGAGAAAPLVPPPPAGVDPLGWENPAPVFDEKAAEAMVDVAISGLNYLGAFVVRMVGNKEIPDKAVVDAAVARCQVTEEARLHLRCGGVALARLHQANLAHLPYLQVGVGLAMWAGAVGGQVKTLKDEGKTLRGEPAS